MKAFILAGGKGTRLAPYTTIFPKPLVPIGNMPILDIVVHQLSLCGFNEIILCVGYLAELIKAYFQNSTGGNRAKLTFIRENKPLGTAGALSMIQRQKEAFLVMNGDILTTLNFSNFISFHKENSPVLTIAMKKKQVKIDLGVLEIGENNQVVNYLEKPVQECFVSMGIYIYQPVVLRYIRKNEYLDFPNLVLRLLEAGEQVMGYPSEDYWIDVGRYEDYIKAVEDFERMGETAFLKSFGLQK